jgi:SLT domain-containing protein
MATKTTKRALTVITVALLAPLADRAHSRAKSDGGTAFAIGYHSMSPDTPLWVAPESARWNG